MWVWFFKVNFLRLLSELLMFGGKTLNNCKTLCIRILNHPLYKIHSIVIHLVCEASVSIWFRSKERPVLAAREMKWEPFSCGLWLWFLVLCYAGYDPPTIVDPCNIALCNLATFFLFCSLSWNAYIDPISRRVDHIVKPPTSIYTTWPICEL